MLLGVQLLYMTGLGWGNSFGKCAGPRLQVCTFF